MAAKRATPCARARLKKLDGIEADDVIMGPDRAKAHGLRPTLCFPVGNIAVEGSVIKSTAIDPSLVDAHGIYRKTGPARVFVSESTAMHAIKRDEIQAGDILVLICGGPTGSGMQEIYQVTSALKHLPFGKHVAVVTDARFSGVSTGACIGHVSPEALAGGSVGKIIDGDILEIVIDQIKLEASVNFVGEKRDVLMQKKALDHWLCVTREMTWPLTPTCRMTHGSGQRSFMRVAEFGAAGLRHGCHCPGARVKR